MAARKSNAELAALHGGSQRALEHLRTRAAYYRARLVDIDDSPRHSRHREGRDEVAARLHETLQQLSQFDGNRQ